MTKWAGASWGMKGEWMKKNCNKKYEELGAEPSEEYFFCKVVGQDSKVVGLESLICRLLPISINATEFFHQDLYKQYSNACKIYGNEPLLSYYSLIKNYPMYVFSTQNQDRDVFSSRASKNIYLKKSSATTYRWYVLYLENKWYKSKLLPNGMSRPMQVTFNAK